MDFLVRKMKVSIFAKMNDEKETYFQSIGA